MNKTLGKDRKRKSSSHQRPPFVLIDPSLRSKLLINNQHACCVCGKSGVQIHHINGDHSDNKPSNLAVLCLPHHDVATASSGLSARLRPEEIRQYKKKWEEACLDRVKKGARARTAFFMVDYKNAERIRQLFSQLSLSECESAYQILSVDLRQETSLREEQGFNVSIEPTLIWSTPVERLLESLRHGQVHPAIFDGLEGHPQDPLLPSGPAFSDWRIPVYDIWCQLMVRAIVAVRTPFLINDLALLEDPVNGGLAGSLVAFEGRMKGAVATPDEWEEKPGTETTLTVEGDKAIMTTKLRLKTHYVYSFTAAQSLSNGRGCGLLIIRSIDLVRTRNRKRVMAFSSTPLIIGSGGGKLLEIP